MRTAKEWLIENTKERGIDFGRESVSMTGAECLFELNALRKHLRKIPKSDNGERAVALACIMHIRLRQLVLASAAAANERAKDVSFKKKMYRKRVASEAKE